MGANVVGLNTGVVLQPTFSAACDISKEILDKIRAKEPLTKSRIIRLELKIQSTCLSTSASILDEVVSMEGQSR